MPRTPWSIDTVESSGDMVEENLRLFFAPGEYALQIDFVVWMFWQLLRAANGELDKFARNGICEWIEFVECALAFAPRGNHLAVREQTKMRGDARLTEACDFLEFVHGKFIALQQRDDADACWIGQRAEGFKC